MTNVEQVVAIITAAGTAFAAILTVLFRWFRSNNGRSQDLQRTLIDGVGHIPSQFQAVIAEWQKILGEQRAENERYRRENEELRKELDAMRDEVDALRFEVQRLQARVNNASIDGKD